MSAGDRLPYEEGPVAKQVLKTLDLTALLVALDHLEEYGPNVTVPLPYARPAECVYLAYIHNAHLAALAARLPHVMVLFRTPADGPRNKVVRPVFDKTAVLYVLQFCFPGSTEFAAFVRDLGPISPRRWAALDAEGKSIPRPRPAKAGPQEEPA